MQLPTEVITSNEAVGVGVTTAGNLEGQEHRGEPWLLPVATPGWQGASIKLQGLQNLTSVLSHFSTHVTAVAAWSDQTKLVIKGLSLPKEPGAFSS